MTAEQIRALYDFNAWANARTLEPCAALSKEQFLQNNGSSFPSVRDTLTHIYGAEWIWLERWQGRRPGGLPKPEDFADLPALRAAWDKTARELLDFAYARTQEQLLAAQTVYTLDGTPYTHPLWQMMQHLVNHGSYHRGQIAAFLRQLGHKPQPTDLIRYYREHAAAAAN
jgi:uncharacterized damage-inducible protein DinB